jgi:hypothetical protein
MNPAQGGAIEAARDFGIDLTQLVENLRLTPAERIKRNDEAVNSMRKFADAMRDAKVKRSPKKA